MNFKFATGILTRLGEELISNPEHGLIELVKNSYDADAINCTIELKEINDLGGTIIISDDGIGMDLKAIDDSWFLIGNSRKTIQKITPLGRQPAGNKGLGRIAALRLGTRVTLITRSISEPGVEYSLTINWEEFEKVDVVESITFEPQQKKTEQKNGTKIIIENLQVKLGRSEVEKLARELILLADPFGDNKGFHPILIASEFSDLEKQVLNAYFDNAEFHLKARLDEIRLGMVNRGRLLEPQSGRAFIFFVTFIKQDDIPDFEPDLTEEGSGPMCMTSLPRQKGSFPTS